MSTQTSNRTAETKPMFAEDIITHAGARMVLAAGRLIMGWTFLWAFIDKLFGMGFSTQPEAAWIRGGTPAQGYISRIEEPLRASSSRCSSIPSETGCS